MKSNPECGDGQKLTAIPAITIRIIYRECGHDPLYTLNQLVAAAKRYNRRDVTEEELESLQYDTDSQEGIYRAIIDLIHLTGGSAHLAEFQDPFRYVVNPLEQKSFRKHQVVCAMINRESLAIIYPTTDSLPKDLKSPILRFLTSGGMLCQFDGFDSFFKWHKERYVDNPPRIEFHSKRAPSKRASKK